MLLDWVVVGLVITLFDWLVSALFDCWLVVLSVIAAWENGPARPWPPCLLLLFIQSTSKLPLLFLEALPNVFASSSP